MDRGQLLNDAEEAMRQVLDGRQVATWTAIPGIVDTVDLSAMTCSVKPALKATIVDENGNETTVELPLLINVPIVFPSSGGFALTFPIAADDEVLVVFSCRAIDAWWQSGGVQEPVEARMHDLSDGFAIPGPKSTPNVLSSISSTKVQLRNDAGTVYFGVGTKFAMHNASTDLKTVLSDLQSLLNSFMTTLSGFSGGGSPVTQAMLQAPAATAVTQLSLVLTKIGQLLE